MFEYFPYVFAGVSVLVAISAARRLLAARRFEARAGRAAAEVTDVREEWVSGDKGQHRIWVPVVRFTTGDGRTVEAETTPHRGFGRPEAGDPLEVLYDPANPADVRLATGATGVLSGLATVAVGVVLAVIALTVFRP
jgi:Protein of unknown function (DUF3592)